MPLPPDCVSLRRMSEGFACLVIADESPEFPAALIYAAHLAKAGGWRLIMLHVIEPSEPAPWVTVSEEIQRQALANAEALLGRFAAEAWAEAGVTAESAIRQGELRAELRKFVESEDAVKLVVLAASAGPGGPGPLIASLAKGGHAFGARPLPVMVVPGALSSDEVRALARPAAPA